MQTKWISLRLLSAALACCAVTACGGGGADSTREQSLTLDLDGEPMVFNGQLSANDPPSEAEVHFVTVGGHIDEDPLSPGFTFQLVSEEPVALGTYSSAQHELHATYYVQTADDGTVTATGDGIDDTSFTMTLTALDDRGVEGTFSGLLRRDITAPLMRVENGRFSATYNGR